MHTKKESVQLTNLHGSINKKTPYIYIYIKIVQRNLNSIV